MSKVLAEFSPETLLDYAQRCIKKDKDFSEQVLIDFIEQNQLITSDMLSYQPKQGEPGYPRNNILEYVISNKLNGILSALINHAHVKDIPDDINNTLIYACRHANVEAVTTLLAHKDSDANFVGQNGVTPLIATARGFDTYQLESNENDIREDENRYSNSEHNKKLMKIVKLLLAKNDININYVVNHRDTIHPAHSSALAIAVGNNNLNLLTRLLEKDSIDVNILDHRERTPLILACNPYKLDPIKIEVVKALLTNPEIDINHQDNAGNTALMHICQGYKKTKNHRIIANLLTNKKNINRKLKNNNGSTAEDLLVRTPFATQSFSNIPQSAHNFAGVVAWSGIASVVAGALCTPVQPEIGIWLIGTGVLLIAAGLLLNTGLDYIAKQQVRSNFFSPVSKQKSDINVDKAQPNNDSEIQLTI